MDSKEYIKKLLGKKAVEYVKEGMKIGLGTGSTATFFIEELILKCKNGLKIEAIATSNRSYELALKGNIPIIKSNEVKTLDLCIDGADEIDSKKTMIKGGGGALLREKIVASMSQEMIVLVDESKIVKSLGRFPLPVEIVAFGYLSTITQINSLGLYGSLRKNKENEPFITDEGHYIYDISDSLKNSLPEVLHAMLLNIPGVIETGLFINLAGRVLIGKEDGEVVVWE